jgi:hypothetical protein
VGGSYWIPALAGGNNRMQLTQDRRRDHGLGLGGGQPVLLTTGQVGESGSVNRVRALRTPGRRQAASRRPGRPWPVSLCGR